MIVKGKDTEGMKLIEFTPQLNTQAKGPTGHNGNKQMKTTTEEKAAIDYANQLMADNYFDFMSDVKKAVTHLKLQTAFMAGVLHCMVEDRKKRENPS
jgi:hypothetical protein